jgi:hypothetical protein
MVAQAPCSPTRQCWLRAWDRARTEKLIPYRNADGSWNVKFYTITVTGPGWSDLSCNCAGGSHSRICKHAAVVAFAISAGVRPIRPEVAAVATLVEKTGTGTAVYLAHDPLMAAFS